MIDSPIAEKPCTGSSISSSELSALVVGLDLFKAKNRVCRHYRFLEEDCFDITYVESTFPRGIVLKSNWNPSSKTVSLQVSSSNPIKYLPVNYQENDFLRGFLMIFQHISNSSAITLDNIHNYFNPMECPASFLSLLSDWFGISLDTLGGEDEVRRFLRYAVPLYRFRGTSLGLRAHLAIITGVVPEIFEKEIPFPVMEISDDAEIESSILDAGIGENSFTIYFPVLRESFDSNLIKRISLIAHQEKPVHARCFISFKKKDKATRNTTMISVDTVLGIDDGITF